MNTLHDLHLWKIFAVKALSIWVCTCVEDCVFMCVCFCVDAYVCVCVMHRASSVESVVSYRACQLKRIIGLRSRRLVMTARERVRKRGRKRERQRGGWVKKRRWRGVLIRVTGHLLQCLWEPLGASGLRTDAQRELKLLRCRLQG